jgi:hypothetical protein
MRSRRILATGLIGASLATMAVVDRFVDRPIVQSAVAAKADVLGDTATSDSNSGSSLWFCAAGESADGIDTTITIVNPTGQAGSGTVSFLGNAGQRAIAEVKIGAYARTDVRVAESVAAVGVGAIVEFNVGGLAVEQNVVRGNQTYGTPCATSASTSWYFADGDTTLGASSVLSVLNPFGEDAVLDLSFVTERGAARPNDLQGFLVPASSMRRIDIGTYVRRRAQVSTVVKARVGRVVANQTTSPDAVRYSLVNGSPGLGSSWYFPAGRTNGVLRERYVLFNPTAADVSAQIDVVVEGGEVEPFELDVPARSRVDLVPNEESRIARDTDYSVVVATDSPSLVVQRTLRASGIYRAGFATTLGSRSSATDWVVPDVVSSATRDDTIALLNPTDTPTAISLFLNSDAQGNAATDSAATPSPAGNVEVGVGIAVDGKAPQPLEGAQNLLLKASSRLTLRLSDFAAIADGSLIVRSSSAEIVVERTASAMKRRGKRTDRPPYTLADASSLAIPPDTVPGTGDGVGSVDPGLPVDETYGADESSPTTNALSTAALGLLEAPQTIRFGEFFAVAQVSPSTTQSSTTNNNNNTNTNNTNSEGSTSLARSTIPLATSSSASATSTRPASVTGAALSTGSSLPVTTTKQASSATSIVGSATSKPAETAVATSSTINGGLRTTTVAPVLVPSTGSPETSVPSTTIANDVIEPPQPKQPQMGLGPPAKAGAYTFSAVAIPLRSTSP